MARRIDLLGHVEAQPCESALSFLQQLGCIIVVWLHSPLQAGPMPSGASRLLNWFHETEVHES